MLQRWRVWGVLSVVFAVAAETLNILIPEQHFIQWVLFILAVICFILAITAWERQKSPAAPDHDVPSRQPRDPRTKG